MHHAMNTTTIPTDIARILAERARQDLERAAEKAADYRNKANKLRWFGNNEDAPLAAVYYAKANSMDLKAERFDAEFRQLESVCIALTKAGV